MGLFDAVDSTLGKALGVGAKPGTNAGNAFGNAANQAGSQQAISDALGYQGSKDALDPLQSSRTATSEVQNNGILGQLYGEGGQLGQATQEETQLANAGYALQPQDYTAYGQASGDLTRQFGASDNNLAAALADRGLSGSGAAGTAFTTSQGNKQEQLAGLQRQIADNRMQSNMARLNQTRNYISQLGAQGASAIQGQYGRQLGSEQQRYGETMGKAGLGQSYLGAGQEQANQNFNQTNATASGGLGGALGRGFLSGAQAQSGGAIAGLTGSPQLGGGGPQGSGMMGNQAGEAGGVGAPAMDPKKAAMLVA